MTLGKGQGRPILMYLTIAYFNLFHGIKLKLQIKSNDIKVKK